MPSPDTLDAQDHGYRQSVLPSDVWSRMAIEAASVIYWDRFVGLDGKVIGVNSFGESAPARELFKEFSFTEENVANTALQTLR